MRSLVSPRSRNKGNVNNISSDWREEDSGFMDVIFSGELKIDDVMVNGIPHSELERNKSADSELSGDSSLESSIGKFDTSPDETPVVVSDDEIGNRSSAIRHISFAHQEPRSHSTLPEVEDDDPLSVSQRSSSNRSFGSIRGRRSGSLRQGGNLSTIRKIALSSVPRQSLSRHSRTADDDSLSTSDRSSVICSLAKRHIDSYDSDRSLSRSPVPPPHGTRNLKSRISAGERLSVSSAKPNSDQLDTSERSTSQSPGSLRGRRKVVRSSVKSKTASGDGNSVMSSVESSLDNSVRSTRSGSPGSLRGRRKISKKPSSELGKNSLDSSERSTGQSPGSLQGRRKVVQSSVKSLKSGGDDNSVRSTRTGSPGSLRGRRNISRNPSGELGKNSLDSSERSMSQSPGSLRGRRKVAKSSVVPLKSGGDDNSVRSTRSGSLRGRRKISRKPSGELGKNSLDSSERSMSQSPGSLRGRQKVAKSSVVPLKSGGDENSARSRGRKKTRKNSTESLDPLDKKGRSKSPTLQQREKKKKKRKPSTERLGDSPSRKPSSERLRTAPSRKPSTERLEIRVRKPSSERLRKSPSRKPSTERLGDAPSRKPSTERLEARVRLRSRSPVRTEQKGRKPSREMLTISDEDMLASSQRARSPVRPGSARSPRRVRSRGLEHDEPLSNDSGHSAKSCKSYDFDADLSQRFINDDPSAGPSGKPRSERVRTMDTIERARPPARSRSDDRSPRRVGRVRSMDTIERAKPPARSRSDRSPRRVRSRSVEHDEPLCSGSDRSGKSAASFDLNDDLPKGSNHFSRRIVKKANDALSKSEHLMTTGEHDGKVRAVMDGLSINKLQFDNVGLIGRGKESDILRKRYDRLEHPSGKSSSLKKELIFVHGYSGVGKSKLVSSVMEICDKSGSGYCARGKFDYSSVDYPYTAVASAYSQMLANIKKSGKAVSTYDEAGHMQTLREALTEKLGSDIHLLSRLIPELEEMTPKLVLQLSFRKRDSQGFDDAGQNRWEHAILVLTRELNKIYSPLVLCLDDMHWADNASLNLIDALISDVENKNPFMFIGSYRSNEVGKHHILPKKLEQLKTKRSNHGFNFSKIKINNLNKEGVHEVVMSLLSMDDKKATEALADICFRRTLGNPFFLMEFMAMLNDEKLIEYSLGLMKWTWDEEVVERETMSTENVVDIVHSRMKKLSKNSQIILEYASCLGNTIRLECMEILMSNLNGDQDAEASLSVSMRQLVKKSFFEMINGDEYRWVHDNVRESAKMLGDASSPLFQFQVGNTLFHNLDDFDLDEMLFEVCDLINLGEHSRREEFAKLNLKAAEKARRRSAFKNATDYARKGIGYLQNDKWTEQHDITLPLYNLAIEMELVIGRVEETTKYCEEILAQSNCTPIEKLKAYLAKSHKMTHMDMDYKGCTDLLLGILSESFDIQLFTKKAVLPIQAISSLLTVARKVKRLPEGALAKLEPDVDPDREAAMELLARLSISAYLGEDMLLHVRCITKMVNMTLKHGVHSMSGFAFVGLGTCVMTFNGDASEGAEFATMADQLQVIAPDDYAEASISTISNLMVLPWTSALNACRATLKQGYSKGLRAGNTEHAMLSLFGYNITMPLQMGKPLSSIQSKCAAIAAQCEELKLGLYAVSVRQYWELILRLMGKPDKSVFSESEVLQSHGWKPQEMMTEYVELHSSVYSGDFETASEIALRMGDGFQKANPNNILIMSETFLRALALYATASSSKNDLIAQAGNMISKQRANKLREKMGIWVKMGNPNVGHCYHLLSAEKSRLDGKYDKANGRYNDAIVLAARTGHVHHAALANERYADFLLHCMKDKDESDYRLKEAIRFYQDWGAEKRVQELTKQLEAGKE